MTIYIDPEYVTRIEDENEQLKDKYKRLIKKNNKTTRTMIDLYNEKIKLIEENNKLKQELFNLYLKHYN